MQFGVFMFPTDFSIGPAELARAVEERGFESLLFPEHTHIPASRLSDWPGGGELPQEYSHVLDPFVALTVAAAATTRLRLGTGICLVIERDPIVLAKEVASVDVVSGGRFLFGIGGGWNREEMENHGTDYTRRWKLLRERIEAMKEIWSSDEATYHGEFVNFERIWSWPKPAQKPHPPILVGGDGERTLQRVVRYGDEWMPLGRSGRQFGERIKELAELAAKAGRGRIPVSIFAAPSDPATLEQYRRDGVDRALFPLPPADADRVLARLDKLTALVRGLNGN
ncbi:MAG: LLM class F420-dependent oxidoreductase [SAR324 cluster bacterium]|nr:LLM class F420-dependent oxidoreductase [SAR324 cluster bacterium]